MKLQIFGYLVLMAALLATSSLASDIRHLIAAKQFSFQSRADLPEFFPVRFIPKQVAQRYASDTFQNPQEYLGDSQIIINNGRLTRVMPRYPEQEILYFINKMTGFVTVNVDTLDKQVSIEDTVFKYSDGIGITDNLYYKLDQKRFFATYASEPIYLKDDNGKWITAVSYIKYKGFPFTVPYWAGTMIIQPDGTMTDYSPEQVQELSFVKGNRVYPKELVTFYSDAYSYRGGLINKWFLHKNQTEIVNISNDEDNPETTMHVATNEGYKQIVVAEPYGASYGIYKIFIFDATTGKREIVEYDQSSQLTGPIAATDYIKREFPSYSWDSFYLSEPRPYKIGDDLYWMMSIIPRDAAGIAKTVLFNAKTNKVISIENEKQLSELKRTGAIKNEPVSSAPLSATQIESIRNKISDLEKEITELKELVK